MPEINVIIRDDWLLETSLDEDLEIVQKFGRGEMLSFNFTRIRDPLNHRRYFAMHRIAYENRPPDYLAYDKRSFRKLIEMTAGFREPMQTFSGRQIYVARSIKYSDLDEPEFQELKRACGDVIAKKVLNINESDLQSEVLNLAAINPKY